MFVVFRFDAGPGIGAGHAIRCLALARRLRRDGVRCAVAARLGTREYVDADAEAANEWFVIDGPTDMEPSTMAARWPGGADLIVVDHYGWTSDLEANCRPWARRIVAIDDLADRKRDCDVLVNQSPGARQISYEDLTPDGCEFILGPRFAMLRPEFSLERQRKSNPAPSKASRILIAFGASSAGPVVRAALDAIEEVGFDGTVDVLAASNAADSNDIDSSNTSNCSRSSVNFRGRVASPAALMAGADLCLGAGGVSALERCCLAIPSVIAILADNQRPNAEGLAAAGAALVFDFDPNTARRKFADLATSLIENDGLRVRMSEAAANLCDGDGAQRVAVRLMSQREFV